MGFVLIGSVYSAMRSKVAVLAKLVTFNSKDDMVVLLPKAVVVISTMAWVPKQSVFMVISAVLVSVVSVVKPLKCPSFDEAHKIPLAR